MSHPIIDKYCFGQVYYGLCVHDVVNLYSVKYKNSLKGGIMENQITDRPTKFCKNCGEKIDAKAEICPKCGVRQESPQAGKNKVVAGLLAIFLGGLGIHKFYLGKPVQGILYIFLLFFFISPIIAFIEGIIYLTMSDEAFNAKYNKR